MDRKENIIRKSTTVFSVIQKQNMTVTSQNFQKKNLERQINKFVTDTENFHIYNIIR